YYKVKHAWFVPERQHLGVFADYADFTTEHEWASELTCKFLFGKSGYVQPAFHLIANTRECNWVGLIRLGYEI
ncbi:MAG: hypothetical protein ACLTSS_03465, partial [Phocaeicola coprocola]